MINRLKMICISGLIIPSIALASTAIVNTDILLVKKTPSNSSDNNRYYEMNKVIDVEKIVDGLDNDDKWYKISKGYIKSRYVLLEEQLPKFINEDEVIYNKFALQLIVYKNTVVQSLVKLRKILRNENNIYLQESKNVYVIYLVNFDSYTDAKNKSKELKNIFTSNFITKIKRSKKEIKKKELILNNEIDENIDINEFAKKLQKEESLKKLQKPKKEEIKISKKEKIILENKEVKKRPDNNGIKKIRNLESIKVIEVKKEKKINNLNFKPEIKAPSYEEMIENILIELNK